MDESHRTNELAEHQTRQAADEDQMPTNKVLKPSGGDQAEKPQPDGANTLSTKVQGHDGPASEREHQFHLQNSRLNFGTQIVEEEEERILDFDNARARVDGQQVFPDFLKFKTNLAYDASFLMEEQEQPESEDLELTQRQRPIQQMAQGSQNADHSDKLSKI